MRRLRFITLAVSVLSTACGNTSSLHLAFDGTYGGEPKKFDRNFDLFASGSIAICDNAGGCGGSFGRIEGIRFQLDDEIPQYGARIFEMGVHAVGAGGFGEGTFTLNAGIVSGIPLIADVVHWRGSLSQPYEVDGKINSDLDAEGVKGKLTGNFTLFANCGGDPHVTGSLCGGKLDPSGATDYDLSNPWTGNDCPDAIVNRWKDGDTLHVTKDTAQSGKAKAISCLTEINKLEETRVLCGLEDRMSADGCDWALTVVAGPELGLHISAVAPESCKRAEGRFCNAFF